MEMEVAYIGGDGNDDWTKQTLDLYLPVEGGGMRQVANVDDVRAYVRLSGTTVAEFKRTWTYRHALRKQPWLRAL
jgi:hypothetical protein